MTWFRVDDGFAEHPKVELLEADPKRYMAAITVWTVMGADCSRRLTDGYVSTSRLSKVLGHLGKSAKDGADALVSVGIWDHADDGWTFRNWSEYQPTKADVESARKAKTDRQRRWRSASVDASTATSTNASTNASVDAAHARVSRPDPTHPNQERESGATSDAAKPPERASKPKAPDTHSAAIADPDVIRLLAVYRELHGKDERWNPAAKEGKHSRAAHIFRALHGLAGDRLTAEEIEYAFRGNHADEWHRSRGKHEIEYVLRPSKVGQFIATGKAPSSPQKAAEQDGRGVALAEIKKRHDEALRAANECALRGDDEGKVRLTLEAKNLRAEFARIREAS